MGSGTLYPLLARLEAAGWFTSEWEDVDPSEVGRPRRRLYKLHRHRPTTSKGRLFSGLQLGTGGASMGYLMDIGLGSFASLVAAELSAHAEPASRAIVERAVRRLPVSERARWREEWLAHLNETPGAIRKLLHGAECHIAALSIARFHSCASRHQKRAIARDKELDEIRIEIEQAQTMLDEIKVIKDWPAHGWLRPKVYANSFKVWKKKRTAQVEISRLRVRLKRYD